MKKRDFGYSESGKGPEIEQLWPVPFGPFGVLLRCYLAGPSEGSFFGDGLYLVESGC